MDWYWYIQYGIIPFFFNFCFFIAESDKEKDEESVISCSSSGSISSFWSTTSSASSSEDEEELNAEPGEAKTAFEDDMVDKDSPLLIDTLCTKTPPPTANEDPNTPQGTSSDELELSKPTPEKESDDDDPLEFSPLPIDAPNITSPPPPISPACTDENDTRRHSGLSSIVIFDGFESPVFTKTGEFS